MKIKSLNLKKGHRFSSPNKMGQVIITVILLAFFSGYTYSQNVIHVSELDGSGVTMNNRGYDFERASSLIYKRNSAAYFKDGQMKYYGQTSPVVLFVDENQLSAISGQIDKLSKVEMVKIYLNRGSVRAINKSVLYDLPRLKYVFLVCERCVISEMTNFLPPQDGAVRDILIIYDSEIKE